MAFLGDKTRKTLEFKHDYLVDVSTVDIKNEILILDGLRLNFKRLGYKGCPTNKKINTGGEYLYDQNRWDIVLKFYDLIVNNNYSPRHNYNIFNNVLRFFKFCDDNSLSEILSINSVYYFVKHLKEQYERGIKGATLSAIQKDIKYFISEIAPELTHNCEDIYCNFPQDTDNVKAYTDTEVKNLVKTLYEIFNSYKNNLLEGIEPNKHPLSDRLVLVEGINQNLYPLTFKHISSYTWKNELIIIAYYLISFYTGINESSLLGLKFTDIHDNRFLETSKSSFSLVTNKNRQNTINNISEIGFSKHAKNFFETWLLLIKLIVKDNCDYVFPKIKKYKFYKQSIKGIDSKKLNYVFTLLGLPRLSNQRFRKTKATLIMRATESIFKVSEGLNNSPETAAKAYANGVPEQMEFTLAGALNVKHKMVEGKSLKEAVEDSVYSFAEPVRHEFYLKHKLEVPPVVPNGLHCKEPFGEKAKKLKSALIKNDLINEKDNIACHKFMDCFGCEHHAVIAEVNDVWLLLSFKDVILDALCYPSINTLPKNKLKKISNTIDSILVKIQTQYKEVFLAAEEKNLQEAHPLWNDSSDINLLMDVF